MLGTRMTYLALPWFVLVTTGSPGKMALVLAAEIAPMAILGIPSGAAGPAARLSHDDARRGLRARADPRVDPAAARARNAQLRAPARRSSRCSAASWPPYFASQRTILPELVGEDERLMSQGNSLIEGGAAFAALIGPALAGLLIPFIGAPNVLYVDAATYLVAFLLVLVLRAAAEADRGRGAAEGPRGASLPARRPAARPARRGGRRVRLPRRRADGRASVLRVRGVLTGTLASPGSSTPRSAPARSSAASSPSPP